MSWLRIDDDFANHPKINRLTDRERWIWMRLLCYAARYEDPTVDKYVENSVVGLTANLILKLNRVGLLDEVGVDVYEIHDWIHYQPKDKTAAERMKRWRSRNGLRYGETVTPSRPVPKDHIHLVRETIERSLSTGTGAA